VGECGACRLPAFLLSRLRSSSTSKRARGKHEHCRYLEYGEQRPRTLGVHAMMSPGFHGTFGKGQHIAVRRARQRNFRQDVTRDSLLSYLAEVRKPNLITDSSRRTGQPSIWPRVRSVALPAMSIIGSNQCFHLDVIFINSVIGKVGDLIGTPECNLLLLPV